MGNLARGYNPNLGDLKLLLLKYLRQKRRIISKSQLQRHAVANGYKLHSENSLAVEYLVEMRLIAARNFRYTNRNAAEQTKYTYDCELTDAGMRYLENQSKKLFVPSMNLMNRIKTYKVDPDLLNEALKENMPVDEIISRFAR